MSHVRIEGLTKRFAGKPPAIARGRPVAGDRAGRVHRAARPERLREDHDAALPGRSRDARRRGGISLGGHTVLDVGTKVNLPPNKRRIGMVFQSYALWPHMTVRKNIGYPLRARRIRREQSRSWVEETAATGRLRRTCSTAIRRSSAAASSSAWRWPAAWWPDPTWCCSTSR